MLAAPLTGWLGDRFPPQAPHHRRRGAVERSHSRHRLGPRLLHPLHPPRSGRRRRGHLRHLRPRRPRRLLSRARPQPHPLHLLSGHSRRRGSRLPCRRANWARSGAGAAPFFVCAIPGLIIAALYGVAGREPERGASDHIRPTPTAPPSSASSPTRPILTATFGLAALTFAMGGISAWVPNFCTALPASP